MKLVKLEKLLGGMGQTSNSAPDVLSLGCLSDNLSGDVRGEAQAVGPNVGVTSIQREFMAAKVDEITARTSVAKGKTVMRD